jgi:hypothetical protein
MGPLTDAELTQRIQTPQVRKYAQVVDRESAREMLMARHANGSPSQGQAAQSAGGGGLLGQILGSSITRSVIRTAAVAITGTLVRDAMGVLRGKPTRRSR